MTNKIIEKKNLHYAVRDREANKLEGDIYAGRVPRCPLMRDSRPHSPPRPGKNRARASLLVVAIKTLFPQDFVIPEMSLGYSATNNKKKFNEENVSVTTNAHIFFFFHYF